MARISRWGYGLLVLGTTVGAVTLIWVLFFAGESVTISLSAAPGGSMRVEGGTQHPIGSPVTVVLEGTPELDQPGLLLDGEPVQLVSGDDGSSRYTFEMAGNHVLAATFAHVEDDARPLDAATAATLQHVAPDGTSATFVAATPLLERLRVGDVLTNGIAPDTRAMPLLMKVTGINDGEGDAVVVTGQPAQLTDFVRHASVELDLQMAFDPDDDAQAMSSGGLRPPATVLTADDRNANGLIHGLWGGMELTGNLDVSAPQTELAFSMEWFSVKSFSATISQTTSASVELSGSNSSQVGGEMTVFDRDVAAMGIPLGPVVVPVTAHLAAGGGASARAERRMNVGADLSVKVRAGVAWDADGWETVAEATPTFDAHADLQSNVRARAHVTLHPSLLVAGLCGPYFDIQPGYLELAADTNADPWWLLSGGVHISGGAECAFSDQPYTVAAGDLIRTNLLEADGPLVAVNTQTDGSRVPGPTPTARTSAIPQPTVAPLPSLESLAGGFRENWSENLLADCPMASPPVDGIYCTWNDGIVTYSGLTYSGDMRFLETLAIYRPVSSPSEIPGSHALMERYIRVALEPTSAEAAYRFASETMAGLMNEPDATVEADCRGGLRCRLIAADRGLGLEVALILTREFDQ